MSTSRRRRLRGIALMAVFAVVIAACGNGTEATTTTAAETRNPVPVRIGAILPQTGGLSSIIAALEQPLRMAADEFNAASAGLVTVDFTDSGTDPNIASQNIDQYLSGNHNAVIGPAASGVANSIWDKVNTAKMAMCSGSSTGALFSGEQYNPFHVRTAPSDLIQAPLLANVIIGDEETNVAVIWRQDDYGVGFGELLAKELSDNGATVTFQGGFDHTQTSFADLAQQIVNSGAEAVAMITFAEGGQILLDLESANFDGQIYVADGFVDTVGPEQVGGRADLLEGIRGTYPSVAPANGEPTFGTRFAAFAPDAPTVFSAHMYDCLVILVLAAQIAQSATPEDYIDEVIGVTRDGEKCTLIADCLAKVMAGTNIDYDGASGPLDFTPNGEPGLGTYDIFTFDASGSAVNEEQQQGSIAG